MTEGLTKLWAILRERKWQVVSLSLLIALTASLNQVTPQFVRYVIDVLIPNGVWQAFAWFGVAVAGFYVIMTLLDYAAMYLSYAFTQGVISDIRMKVYSKLLNLPMERFTGERSGSMVSRVVSDVNALESMIQAGASRIVGQLFSIVVVLVLLLSMNWLLALLSLLIVVGMALITYSFQTVLRRLSRKIRSRVAEMTATATESIGNIAVVKTFAAHDFETERFAFENHSYKSLNLERRKYMGTFQGLMGLNSELGILALLLLGGWLVVQAEANVALGLSIGELSAFLLYLNRLMAPVRFVMNFNNILQSGMAALERIDDVLESKAESEGELGVLSNSSIHFQEVVFSYPETEQVSLQGLSLEIEAGQTVALVGASGAGKSTVIKLLSRLYDVNQGEIRLGGERIQDYQLDTLRSAIAVVPQDPTLFSGSVSDNIRYARPDASQPDIERAARLANAHDFVMALAQGYETEIGERGVKLSGGQRQRIAIARAILRDASILILDEATSSLDAESEAIIQEALEGLFNHRQGVTTIIIAHRLSTVNKAETIFVLNQGKVVEQGNHAELVALDGVYKMLVDLQLGEQLASESQSLAA